MISERSFQRHVRRAEKHFQQIVSPLAEFVIASGRCELAPAWNREPMEALVRAVAHQQLNGRAAEAILGRLLAAHPDQSFPEAAQLLKIRTPKFRSFGFSLAKIESIRGIARGSLDGSVPARSVAERLDDETLIERLTELRGIGRWTVEMLLIFTLGRLDVMPVDDYGVRAGLGNLLEIAQLPKPKEVKALTESWAPYRSVGAWYLWRVADTLKDKK